MIYDKYVLLCLVAIGLAAFISFRLPSSWPRRMRLFVAAAIPPVATLAALVHASHVDKPFIRNMVFENNLVVCTFISIIFLTILGGISFRAPAASLQPQDLRNVKVVAWQAGRPAIVTRSVDRFFRMTPQEDMAKWWLLVLGMIFTLYQGAVLLNEMSKTNTAHMMLFFNERESGFYESEIARGSITRNGDTVRKERGVITIVHDCDAASSWMIMDGTRVAIKATPLVEFDRALSCSMTDPGKSNGAPG